MSPDNAMLQNYIDGTTAETAFRRTMVWDCAPGDREGTLKRLTESEGLAMFKAHDAAVELGDVTDYDNYGQELPAADARRTNYMMDCIKGRPFFVTSTQLIGLTQSNVEAGHHIFIAAGNNHPIVLRPSKKYADTWQVVSECYLHAFMDGAGMLNVDKYRFLDGILSKDPALQALKGTDRNPRWGEITEQPGETWRWLLTE